MLVALLGVVVLAALAVSGVVPGLSATSSAGGPGSPTSAAPVPTTGTRGTSTTSPGATATTPPLPPGPLTVVGLGDSVPSAETCGCVGYVEQVGSQLQSLTHHSWVVHNDATGGWTTADVADDLGSPSTQSHLASADLVLVEVGANDFNLDRVDDQGCFPAAGSSCWASTITGLHDGLLRIIQGIRGIDHRPDLRIALLGYWNVTVDGSVGRRLGEDFVLGSDELTRLVNTTVEQVATATGSVYVDAYTPLKGVSGTRDPTADLLDDGDHPNATGHVLLANAVIDELRTSGSMGPWTVPVGPGHPPTPSAG
ncbi:SGNH/GDSL hydrolase family protein [Terrabacter carboxydivorans]|uniref:SGNH hydrolase-type esterase domain-containing protein n=1 Tax=Terrabacter carboxydivorans TaxID=619730 RepID=A0ABN3KMC8_9MICO